MPLLSEVEPTAPKLKFLKTFTSRVEADKAAKGDTQVQKHMFI